MDKLNEILTSVDNFIWSPYLLIPLLAGTGLWLTIRLGGIQFTKLGAALRLGLIKRHDEGADGDVSHFQALTTALAATVGVGNIVGVSTAIGIGGPGALFWMWVSGLVGMAAKYSEAFLGSKYRVPDANGEQIGGPQIYLERAIHGRLGKVLAGSFALFGALAAFGIGDMTQSNAVVTQIHTAFGIDAHWHWVTGGILTVLVGLVLLGGIKRIGKVTEAFVPAMILFYVGVGTVILVLNVHQIPHAFAEVFTGAFAGSGPVAGGFVGATAAVALQKGMARGLFCNESGIGSAGIVAAAAQTSHPVRQGLVSMTQSFIDTVIVVTFTGMVVITSGVWEHPATASDGTALTGQLTSQAFAQSLHSNLGPILVAISIAFFAFSTILGWSYYGERCAVKLLGIRAQVPYRALFTGFVLVGAVWQLDPVWTLADILNGLMALPNLIGLLLLSGLIARETKAYLSADPHLELGGVPITPLVSLNIDHRASRLVNWVPAAPPAYHSSGANPHADHTTHPGSRHERDASAPASGRQQRQLH